MIKLIPVIIPLIFLGCSSDPIREGIIPDVQNVNTEFDHNGVPVLSTNLPENNAVVVDGVNGYFCATTNDFKERLNQFYKMTDTDYLQLSKNARESIINFDHNKYFADFEKIKKIARPKI